MSTQADKTLVAKIELDNNTYYVTDRYGITLDSIEYTNSVVSWGNVQLKAGQIFNPENAGGGFEVGTLSVKLAFGEKMAQSGFNFDVTDVWNNSDCTVKRWKTGDTTWAGCADFYKGTIKDFITGYGSISFTIDGRSEKDDFMLPAIVVEDQTALTDSQAKSTVMITSDDTATLSHADRFSVNDLLVFTNNLGNTEYNRLSYKVGNACSFKNVFTNPYTLTNGGYCEKAFRHVVSNHAGKSVPIQIGNLSDSTTGKFGKTIIINNKIGKQAILADDIVLKSLTSLGIWDDGSKRYFTGKSTGEYSVAAEKNWIRFKVDTAAVLDDDILDIDSDQAAIVVDDYTKIVWTRETDFSANTPQLVSTNIIAIGSELMLVLEKPASNTIYVERGYGGTDKKTHLTGDAIYQSARYSAKNLLSFTELFYVKAIANQCFADSEHDATKMHNDSVMESKWDNLTDDDLDTGLTWTQTNNVDGKDWYFWAYANFDLQFQQINRSATVTKAYFLLKLYWNLSNLSPDGGHLYIGLFDVFNTSVTYNSAFLKPAEVAWMSWIFYAKDAPAESGTYDAITALTRETQELVADYVYYKPEFALEDMAHDPPISSFRAFEIFNITDLNKRWKIFLDAWVQGTGPSESVWFRLYKMAIMLDFFIDFTDEVTVAPLEGRKVTATVNTVTGATFGVLCENPVDVIALLLTKEMQYLSTDFTANWATVRAYFANSAKFSQGTAPLVATSYGVSDGRKRGWELCEWIASNFNLMLVRDYAGKIDIVNLHELYYDTPAGTEIDITDIRFYKDSGSRDFKVCQTGTDTLYNDIVIKWHRNNSTDEYQQVYRLTDGFILSMSGNSLQGAREQFYKSGRRTLELQSPFIYNADDAARKAQWEADDKAEAKFYVDFLLDADHWDEVAGNSAQYKIGDIVYFKGKADGIDFTATQASTGGGKFYITEVTLANSGREIRIAAKSLQPCTTFTADIDSNLAIKVLSDTGGTAVTGDNVKDDTGGTGVTGDDIKDDTGG